VPTSPSASSRKSSGSRGKGPSGWLRRLSWWKKALLGGGLLLVFAATGTFVYFYVRFSRLIDARLSGDIFNNASLVFAAPTTVRVGQPGEAARIAARLRRAMYAEGEGGAMTGTYRLSGDRLEIHPGAGSYFTSEPIRQGSAALQFRDGRLVSITHLEKGAPLESYQLEPEVITTLFDQTRSKRRLVRYQDLPKVLTHAILATEDHRFFSHSGVNIYRLIAATLTGLQSDERIKGTSTLTMQLARDFFLTRERTLRRKAVEIALALLMEQRLTKEEIFEMYVNQIYLGQRGSFSVYGVGEAATAYFGKDVNSLELHEAALLAGLIHGPNRDSPYKYPERALERRNFVLRRMLEVGFITASQAERASAEPLGLSQQNVEASQAPFFVDMVRDQLLAQFPESDLLSQSYRIYTTLDLDLQRAASEAVKAGMEEVDRELKKKKPQKDDPPHDPNQPQVAFVSLDPATGAVRALVGGRNYGLSQLNHVQARRQPGSSFKPFVYAAALSSGVDGSQPLITPATVLQDEPTTFQFGDEPYEPENYKKEYFGPVTLRQALAMSLNVATVRLAEMVGYDKVRRVAAAAGINKDMLATPALALGAYEATPLEIAGAYTIFANQGRYVRPKLILAVKDSSGNRLWRSPEEIRPVLDPRVSYLMVSLMQSVVNNGTGAGVRSRGIKAPAAGKTGTSHDGWFAGFTSNLLAVVWVGYDDDRELRLSGAYSALPIWAEYMKRALELPNYQDARTFEPPEGITTANLDARTNLVASADTPQIRAEVFIEGTEPLSSSQARGGTGGGILSRIFQGGRSSTVPVVATAPVLPLPPGAPQASIGPPEAHNGEAAVEAPEAKKKGGVIRRFLSIFKGRESPPPAQAQPPKKAGSEEED
jgi:penicillin-binding protein 1B